MTSPEPVDAVVAGDERALARAISRIEDRAPGYRDLVRALDGHAGDAAVVGVTGPPGAGKSTLVDKLVSAYRARGDRVAVLAVDPASPFTGGSVLGDRIRLRASAGDDGVFVRSMSARGASGGIAAASVEAVIALDAAGYDVVVLETVGAGQSEIDVVGAADTVAVIVPPESGDGVQMLKAGILEIADVFVVNKADLAGADRAVRELRAMLETAAETGVDPDSARRDAWEPRVVETVATEARGIDGLLVALDDHAAFLAVSGDESRAVRRRAAQVRAVLREEVERVVEEAVAAHGGPAALGEAADGSPYEVVDAIIGPVEACLEEPDG